MMRRLEMVLSSIGKKELMALTGLGFVGFLIVHLAGNFTLLWGAEAFDGYASTLESLGPLLSVAEWGMVGMAVVHVLTGLVLIYRNWIARGRGYAKKRVEGGRTFASWTMRLTGPWILVFVVLHLVHFTFPHKFIADSPNLSQMVAERLADPIWAVYYILSVAIVGFHISHGFWSAFQTLGAPIGGKGPFREFANVLGIAVGLGFACLAFFVLAGKYLPEYLPAYLPK